MPRSGLQLPPEDLGELPEPHDRVVNHEVHSYRRTNTAHHRLRFAKPVNETYRMVTVELPTRVTNFRAFRSTWRIGRAGLVTLSHHHDPHAVNANQMNRRMRDYKDPRRMAADDSRADALRAAPYTHPMFARVMWGALNHGDTRVAADTAIVFWNYALGGR